MKFRVGAILAGAAMMVAAASPTYAQGVTVGAKVGINFADIASDEDDDEGEETPGIKMGFVAGGFIDVPVTPQFSFAPEVLFTQKGAKIEGEDDGDEFTFSANLTQVQVPVLFKANFSSGSVRPFVVVGPAFGFTASAKNRLEINGEQVGEDADVKDDVEAVEFSLVFGGGVRFGNASIEARYDLGLNDLEKNELDEGKTRTFSILFGYGWSN